MKSFNLGGLGSFDQGVGTVAAGRHILSAGFGKSATGIPITTSSALGWSPYWAGVRVISETFAQVPLHVYKRTAQGREKARDHWLYPILHGRPNPHLTSYQWRETRMCHLCTWGNSYSARAKDGRGRTMELWPLSPDRMTVYYDGADIVYRYVRLDGRVQELKRDDVFHVPALAWDGLVGMSPIAYHRNALGLGLATEEHGSRFFANGINTNFVLTTDNALSDDAFKHLRESIDADHKGLSTAWDPWILEEGLKPVTLSMPNDDAQWLETRKHQVHEAGRILNLDPYKLGVREAGTVSYSSVTQFAVDFVVTTMTPWFVRDEMAAGQQLLGDEWTENGGDYFVEYDLDGLLRGDQTARYGAYHQAIADGWMTRADPREKENLDKIPGLDQPLVPLNMVALQQEGVSYQQRMQLAAELIAKAGFEPIDTLVKLGLPPIAHTGLIPRLTILAPDIADPVAPAPSPTGAAT